MVSTLFVMTTNKPKAYVYAVRGAYQLAWWTKIIIAKGTAPCRKSDAVFMPFNNWRTPFNNCDANARLCIMFF